ncbi:class II glutamine amidotransferase [Chitinibacteraceae bacterium HSL-7]
MCQLLGMNCNTPTDITFSFAGFARRGGETAEHRDGWGIGFFEDYGCRVFLDHLPAHASIIAQVVQHYPIKSRNVVAHIRKATQGDINLANTHPFQRELWGRYWLFAHNGNLTGLSARGTRFMPVGTTDSEQAFCWLLNTLADRYSTLPDCAEVFSALAELTAELHTHGTFNYLLSDGRCLYAHCSTDLYYLIRRAPFHQAHLVDTDVCLDFAEVTTPDDCVAVIATQPLTDNEEWIRLQPGELVAFADGEPVRRKLCNMS